MAKKKKEKSAQETEQVVSEKEINEPGQNKKNPRPKLKTIKSTQMWSPVRDIKDGIVLTKSGEFVQILEFSPINFNLLPEEEQNHIADAFGAAIRIFPRKFQIKVLSRKANVEAHIQHLTQCMEQEKNDKCRAMQASNIQQLRQESVSGISKRFFVAFQYESPGGLRSPEWNEIRSSLTFQAQQIAGSLACEPCNNELLSEIGESSHIADILYNCLCRKEAEFKSFSSKAEDVIASHIMQYGYNGTTTIPVNDFICPQAIDTQPFSYLVVDGKYYCFGYIPRTTYPTRCVAGWLSNLVAIDEGVDLDMWVEQLNTKTVQSQLTYSMQISQSNYSHKSASSADLVALEDKMASENYIRQGLANEQTLCYFSVMLTVVADSPSELHAKFKSVQNQLTAYNLSLRPLHGNHDLAFLSSLPLCSPHKCVVRYARRNILSNDLGSAYPMTSFEINDPGGIRIGKNLENGSSVFLNPFDRHTYYNGNFVLLGGSGSGKTYAIDVIATHLRETGVHVVIIAPYKAHEYSRACDGVGGTFITLAPGSEHNINVMEIRKYKSIKGKSAEGEVSILAAKIQQLHAFFSLLKPDMTQKETQVLDDALITTYRKFGIGFGNKSLLNPLNPSQYKQMPILGDLYKELEAAGRNAVGLKDALARFVTGSAKSFNRPTNVNLDNPFVVIDVSKMPDKLMPIGIFIANDFVYDVIRSDMSRRKCLIIDELTRMIGPQGTPEAAKFVHEQFKTIRGYNAIIGVGTQDSCDFFAIQDGIYGKGIINNAKIKLIMKQEEEEVATVSKMFKLSDTESQLIGRFQRGQGLLISNRNHAKIKVVASPSEHMLFTTDAEELKLYYPDEYSDEIS